MKVAVIGCGAIANAHLQCVEIAGDELVAAVDTNEKSAADAAAKYGGIAVSGVEEMLSKVVPDAAVVATPPNIHRSICTVLLGAGVPVLCEKPLAHTVQDAEALAELARNADVPARVAYCHRFTPASQVMRDYVREGKLGKVLYFRNAFTGHQTLLDGSWRMDRAVSGGGSLIDTASHSIDLFWVFRDFGAPPRPPSPKWINLLPIFHLDMSRIPKRSGTFRDSDSAGVKAETAADRDRLPQGPVHSRNPETPVKPVEPPALDRAWVFDYLHPTPSVALRSWLHFTTFRRGRFLVDPGQRVAQRIRVNPVLLAPRPNRQITRPIVRHPIPPQPPPLRVRHHTPPRLGIEDSMNRPGRAFKVWVVRRSRIKRLFAVIFQWSSVAQAVIRGPIGPLCQEESC